MTRKEAIKHLRSLCGAFNQEAINMAIAALEYKLKPCPFCGTNGNSVQILNPDLGHCVVKCSHCFALIDFFTGEDMTIEKYNTRYAITPEIDGNAE